MKNTIYGTNPIIFHAQGKPQFCPLWLAVKSMCGSKKIIDKDIQIVTFNNGNNFIGKSNGNLEWSVQNQCTVMGSDIKEWKNIFKIALTVQFLENSEAKYVISADSSDVVIYSLDGIIEEFEKKQCSLLYNAEVKCWPADAVMESFEQSTFAKPFCHLNAGAWIGERNAALQFYKECFDSMDFQTNSEQSYVKRLYKKWYPKISIDDTCCIFQTLNGVTETQLEVC